MEECKVRTPMQDGGMNARCEHRCKMAVRTSMQTAMDRNGNGWIYTIIMRCVLFLFCCFCFRCFCYSHPAVVFQCCCFCFCYCWCSHHAVVFARSLASSLYNVPHCPSRQDCIYRQTCTQKILVNAQQLRKQWAVDVTNNYKVQDGHHHACLITAEAP